MFGTILVDFLLFIVGMLSLGCIILSMVAYNQAHLIKQLKRANNLLASDVMEERRKRTLTPPPAHVRPHKPYLVHKNGGPTP